MARVLGVMGESGSGKTTSMRNLPAAETFYLDCDKKGLNWKGWRNQYQDLKDRSDDPEKGYYLSSDIFATVSSALRHINEDERYKRIKYVVIDTLNGLMVAEEMKILAMQSGDKRSAWSEFLRNGRGPVLTAYDFQFPAFPIVHPGERRIQIAPISRHFTENPELRRKGKDFVLTVQFAFQNCLSLPEGIAVDFQNMTLIGEAPSRFPNRKACGIRFAEQGAILVRTDLILLFDARSFAHSPFDGSVAVRFIRFLPQADTAAGV